MASLPGLFHGVMGMVRDKVWLGVGKPPRSDVELSKAVYDYKSPSESSCYRLYRAMHRTNPETATLMLRHLAAQFPRRHKPWHWMGDMAKASGDFEEARRCYEMAYSINRWSPRLAYVLAGLTDFSDVQGMHPVEAGLSILLERGVLEGRKKALAEFALGKVFLDKKSYDQAFDWYQKGNLTVQENVKVVPNLSKSELDKIREVFEVEHFSGVYEASAQPRGPEVFISGMSRSGKTVLENILDISGLLKKGGESPHFAKTCRSFIPGRRFSNISQYVEGLKSGTLSEMRYRYNAAFSDRFTFSNTLPWSIRYFGMLGRLYPATPIIFMTRNFLDLGVASYFKLYMNRYGFSYDLYELGRQIKIYEALQKHWEKVLPNPVIFVSYEDLVNDTRHELERIALFLDRSKPVEVDKILDKLEASASPALGPGQSVDGAIKIRNDFVGFSVNFADKLVPLIRGYNEAVL